MFAGGSYRPMVKKRAETSSARRRGLMMLGSAGLAVVAFGGSMETAHGNVRCRLKVGFYVAMAVSVIGFAFVNPSVSALVSKRSDPARQGEVLGVNQSFASLGRILGPFLGSVLFQASIAHATVSGGRRGAAGRRAAAAAIEAGSSFWFPRTSRRMPVSPIER